MPTALVYRTLGLGDLLTAVPALRAVRRALPRHELVLATSPPLADLVPLIGGVDRLLPTAELAAPDWAGPAPEVAVNLHGAGPQSHEVLRRLRPGRLVAYGNDAAGVPGPAWCTDEHEVRRWCRLVAELGVEAHPGDLGLARPAREPVARGATVVHPGAASPVRCWPPERFAAVTRALADAGHQVVVTGGPAERPLAEEVAARGGLPDECVLAGDLPLAAMAAVVADARLVLCGDTGVAHLATAFGTPSVVLFGPVPPRLWGPPADRPQHRALWHADVLPGTGAGGIDAALLAVEPAEVLTAVVEVAGSGRR